MQESGENKLTDQHILRTLNEKELQDYIDDILRCDADEYNLDEIFYNASTQISNIIIDLINEMQLEIDNLKYENERISNDFKGMAAKAVC